MARCGKRNSYTNGTVWETHFIHEWHGLKEVPAGLMLPWEYRVRWYGDSEDVARRNVGKAAPGGL